LSAHKVAVVGTPMFQFAVPHPTSTAFCAGKNPAIGHFSSRRNTNSRSTSTPPRRTVPSRQTTK